MRRLAIFLALCAGVAAGAGPAPDASKRPVGRAGSTAMMMTAAGAIVRPARDPVAAAVAAAVAERGQGLRVSLRPALRSPTVEMRAIARRQERARGAVCGVPDIQGEYVGAVPGRLGGCGIDEAVRVRSVSGVGLTQKSVMDCTTAKALKTWLEATAKPALRSQGGGLSRLRVAAHYSCRTRNNKAGGRISEHGKGRAIDISGFVLADGSTVTVLKGWTARGTSRTLRQMHRGACGPFGTVLGPEADSYHLDHFHFDTASYRNGSYCR